MSKFTPVRLIVCDRCKEPGGTLRKVGDHYEHNVCPAPPPKPKGQRVVVPRDNIILATPQDVWEMRRKR